MPKLDMDAVEYTENRIDTIINSSMRVLISDDGLSAEFYGSTEKEAKESMQLFWRTFIGSKWKSCHYQAGIAWKEGFEHCYILTWSDLGISMATSVKG